VSRRTLFIGEGSSGFSSAPTLSELPSAKGPSWRSADTLAGADFRVILPTSCGSARGGSAAGALGLHAVNSTAATPDASEQASGVAICIGSHEASSYVVRLISARESKP